MSSHDLIESTQEDDVKIVENVIDLYRTNKITNSNVWNCDLIDKLDSLVRHHNAYVRNFRNIGDSLDATMKVYAIRVDSVCNDIRRLGYGIVPNETSQRSRSKNLVDEDPDLDEPARKSLKKKRKRASTLFNNSCQSNAPLTCIFPPDSLDYNINALGDMGASSRLFVSVLPVKNSLLSLNSNEKFIDSSSYDHIKFHDDNFYEIGDDQNFAMPAELFVKLKTLPLRQNGAGLSGYRIQDTPIDEDDDDNDEDDLMSMDQHYEDDFQPEYQIDDNVESFWANQGIESILNNNNNDHMSFKDIIVNQDLNNNDGLLNNAMKEANNGENFRFEKISKGEYSYQAYTNIKNYWAGPSYWKQSRNHRTLHNNLESPKKLPATRKRRKIIKEKPCFKDKNEAMDDTELSDDETFLKATKKNLKKVRHCNVNRWDSEKLKLPTRCDIPKDLFNFYTFCPSTSTFELHDGEETAPSNVNDYYDDEYDNYLPMDNAITTPEELNGDDGFNFHPVEPLNISVNYEDPPQLVEKIPISFAKRAKVVNMDRLNAATLRSIDKQLLLSTKNRSVCNIDTLEELEPGRALYSIVYRDLLKRKQRFMRKESELTPGLVLFSILNAANKGSLVISKEPNNENNFEIAQLKRQ